MSEFNITIDASLYEDIAFEMDYHKWSLDNIEDVLAEPCNMNQILLCSNYCNDTWRLLDVAGLTNKEVCEKIYTFYKHKTYSKYMGDHRFIEGWFVPTDKEGVFKVCNYGS